MMTKIIFVNAIDVTSMIATSQPPLCLGYLVGSLRREFGPGSIKCNIITGSPHETEEDILQTPSFIKENRLSSFDLYVLTPLPGTAVWDYAEARGLASEEMNWGSLDVDFKSNANNAIILSENWYLHRFDFGDTKHERKSY